MKTACLIWSLLAGVLIPPVMPQAPIDLGVPAYTLAVSPQPRKISVFKDNFIAMSGCQVAVSPIGSPGAKTLNKLPGTFDNQCDLYLIGEVIESTSSFLAIDGRGALSIFQMANNMQSYVRTSYIRMNYTAYYYPRVYKAELVPDTNYVFVAALQTNILFRVLVEPGGTATATRFLTNALSQSYETMAATKNNRLVLMSASGQHMELWDTTSMTFITELEFSPFVFGNIYRSVAAYPLVSQQDFIMAPKTGLVAHFIDLTNRFIVSEFPIKQENPEFCVYVPRTNYFAVLDPNNIDFLNVLDPSMSKTFAINTGLSMDTIGASFFSKSGTGYMILTYAPGGSTNGRVFDLGTHLCHVTCATCTASLDPSRCDTCQIGYSKQSGLCVPTPTPGMLFRENPAGPVASCTTSEYRTSYGSCKACPLDCTSCKDYSGFCNTCATPKQVSLKGDCVASCGSMGQFSSNSVVCRRCHPTCQKCNSFEDNQCTECQTGTVLTSGKCLPSPACNSPENYHWFDKVCLPCFVPPPNSPQLTQGCVSCTNKNLAYSCLTCNPRISGIRSVSLECFQRCPTGTVPATTTSTCLICEQANSPSNVFYNRTCITQSQCPSNAAYNSSSLTCGAARSIETAEEKDDEDDDDDDDDKDRSGVYILIAFGVVCFVLGTVVCIYGVVKSRQRSTIDQPQTAAVVAGRPGLPDLRAESTPIPMDEVPLPAGNAANGSTPNAFAGMDSKPAALPIAQGQKPVQQMNTVFGAPGARQDGIPVVFDQETALLGNAQPKKFQIGKNILDARRSIAENPTPVQQEPVGNRAPLETDGFEEDSLQHHQRVGVQKPVAPEKPNYPSPNEGDDEL